MKTHLIQFVLAYLILALPLEAHAQLDGTEHDTGEVIHDVCAAAYWILSRASEEREVETNHAGAYMVGMAFSHAQLGSRAEQGVYAMHVLIVLQTAEMLTLDQLWTFTRDVCQPMLSDE